MSIGRLQAAWSYSGAEIWRPLFDRYQGTHPDLPIETVRAMLVRPRPMRQIFVEAGRFNPLDKMRKDAATFLDLPNDAKTALRKIKPEYFFADQAVALLFAEIDEALHTQVGHHLKKEHANSIPYGIEGVLSTTRAAVGGQAAGCGPAGGSSWMLGGRATPTA